MLALKYPRAKDEYIINALDKFTEGPKLSHRPGGIKALNTI